ncbi:MAG: ORF6N domain-containing protein [Caldiserica bacterium]|nr:MAG: ORF6N domain-containing protein [Caldisericota bacterium]
MKKEIVSSEEVASKIIEIRGEKVILDSDVALLYGVKTRDVNKAVKNNPEKFPEGYVFQLTKEEFENLRWKFSTAKISKTRVLPKAFTEKGLYMLATILRSRRAVKTTIAIIETFTKLRNITQNIKRLSTEKSKNVQKEIMQKSGKLITEILSDELDVIGSETTFELNFAVLKFKHTIKKKKRG